MQRSQVRRHQLVPPMNPAWALLVRQYRLKVMDSAGGSSSRAVDRRCRSQLIDGRIFGEYSRRI